jgi:hypothetical protein
MHRMVHGGEAGIHRYVLSQTMNSAQPEELVLNGLPKDCCASEYYFSVFKYSFSICVRVVLPLEVLKYFSRLMASYLFR